MSSNDRSLAETDYQTINASGLFDRGFYLRTNPDVAEASLDPLMHFCEYGWREARDPAPFFSMRYYTRVVSQSEELAGNPFVHYLTKGLRNGLPTAPKAIGPSERIPIIRSAEWKNGLTPRIDPCGLDVIIPVYRGVRDTAACIHSVLSSKTTTPFRLVVVNDNSPESQVRRLLGALSNRELFHYIENEENLGFTGSVNAGMNLDPDSHKILLNSDTIVYDGWIDRIVAHADRHKRIGTITPLSNNATILSYPDINASNNYSLETPAASLDLIASAVNEGAIVDVPTGVGFCMFIHRDCYYEVGEFDAATFNRGYGEENDFCVRASHAGWRNVAATDVFVYHTGEVSFAVDAANQQRSGYLALIKKQPTYEGQVRKFISRDPLRGARQRIDLERLIFQIRNSKDIVLFVSHNQSGGIETHLSQLTEQLAKEGVKTLLLSSSRTNPSEFSLNFIDGRLYLPNLSNLRTSEVAEIVLPRLLRSGRCLVHLHSFVGFDLDELHLLLRIIAAAGIRVLNTIHDYSALCPRNQLVDDGEDFCGIPPSSQCNACLSTYSYPGKPTGEPDIVAYREKSRRVLSFAEQTFVPSVDTRNRLAPFLRNLKMSVRTHIEPDRSIPTAPAIDWPSSGSAQHINVVTLGAIGPHKGSNVIWGCAADAARRSLPLKFHVVGYTNIDNRLLDAGVTISGPYYSKTELVTRLRNIGPDIALLPSIWPETHLYTLSDAFELGIFPVAFDIGAQAERIKVAGWGALIDIEDRFNSQFINDTLMSVGEQIRSGEAEQPQIAFASAENIARYYEYSWE